MCSSGTQECTLCNGVVTQMASTSADRADADDPDRQVAVGSRRAAWRRAAELPAQGRAGRRTTEPRSAAEPETG